MHFLIAVEHVRTHLIICMPTEMGQPIKKKLNAIRMCRVKYMYEGTNKEVC